MSTESVMEDRDKRDMSIEETRTFWSCASKFPADKEAVYPQHAIAHEFDEQARKGQRTILLPDGARVNPFYDEPARVLEYGCGGGSDTRSLLRRGAAVTFADVTPENVNVTLQSVVGQGRNATALYLETSQVIGVADGYFDSINCHGVLHHIPEPTMHEVIAEFYRVLKPGGHLYAMLYTEHLFSRLQMSVEHLVARGWSYDRAFSHFTDGGGIARSYSLGGGRELFEHHGFTFVSAIEYNERDFRTFKVRK
jgi:2-polyprenyl-3-methyl-5-hydroxy-6-metoxy-1,4-benzoquinol methylase